MIYYLIHQSPIWKDLPNGKRNVRILFLTLSLYIFVHAIAWEFKDSNGFFKVINGYFFWFMACDIFVSSCVYRNYYGRSIFGELTAMMSREKDLYDEGTHQYVQKMEMEDLDKLDRMNEIVGKNGKLIQKNKQTRMTKSINKVKTGSVSDTYNTRTSQTNESGTINKTNESSTINKTNESDKSGKSAQSVQSAQSAQSAQLVSSVTPILPILPVQPIRSTQQARQNQPTKTSSRISEQNNKQRQTIKLNPSDDLDKIISQVQIDDTFDSELDDQLNTNDIDGLN